MAILVTTMTQPDPILPNFNGACIRGIMPALLAPRRSAWPEWFPDLARNPRAIVVLVLDGLGWEQLQSRRSIAQTLAALSAVPITSVAPSTTATALTSITTGLTPGEHGIVGYRAELGGRVVNMLRWRDDTGDVQRTHVPRTIQPFAPFLGEQVPVITKAEFARTGFTEAHLRGGRLMGWRLPSNIPTLVREAIDAGDRVVYAYYDGIDHVAHERGFGPFYDAELRTADRLVADVIDALPDGCSLLVTADHGQVQVDSPAIALESEVQRLIRGQSGEGRFRWLHTAPAQVDDLQRVCTDLYGDRAWVVTRRQAIDQGWFGPVVSPPVAARFGDVALVPFEAVTFDDPADSGSFPMICRHGSLTSAEMLVPLLAANR